VRVVVNGGNASDIVFRQNWWGAANGPGGAGSGSGDSVSGGVSFTPFLTSSPAGCAVTEVADLTVQVADVPDPLVAGTAFSARIDVTNFGPDPVADATLRLTTPTLLDFQLPDGCIIDGEQIVCAIGAVASGTTVWQDLSMTVPPDASGTFVTTVSVTSSILDPNSNNNSLIVSREIVRRVDLSVLVQADDERSIEGADATFQVIVANAGPSHANGAVVEVPVPVGLSALAWTCSGAGGGICAASGSGAIDAGVTLPAGGEIVYVITGHVGDVPSLTINASVAPPDGV
jgi:uncharacterized repeat protein (TIGR01451 family)